MTIRNSQLFIVLVVLPLLSQVTRAQDVAEEQSYPTHPRATAEGIVFSDNFDGTLYLSRSGNITTLARARGIGRYWTVSPDGKTIGAKKILDDGNQVPLLIDIATGSESELSTPVPLAGQVSFAADGLVAFTIGKDLVVKKGGTERRYNLGEYVNIAPLSPDGARVAFADASGHIWVTQLNSGEMKQVSSQTGAYAFPQWSPDGQQLLFAGLSATAHVVDFAGGTRIDIPEAWEPSWSPDGNAIIYARREVTGEVLTNSDLYEFRIAGRSEKRCTATPAVCEMDPSYLPDNQTILYQTYGTKTVATLSLKGAATGSVSADMRSLRVSPSPEPQPAQLNKTQALDIPYVNQVYDTPDWFNGYAACGPTTSAMLLAHYRIVPPWPGWISKNGGHLTYYGRYVCDIYRFRQTLFTWQAEDPSGTQSQGGYGFMWGNGSPHSYMGMYYELHGMSTYTIDSPPLQDAINEVQAGRPYSMCVDLTSAGHIVLAHGYLGNGTLVTNDPYGDKNQPGYPNRFGKGACYDWPGYNNGHISFGQYVYWAVRASYTSSTPVDTLVDDMQFSHGFLLYNQAPVSMATWKDFNKGYAGHFWYTLTHNDAKGDSCFVSWTPNLPADGDYEVYVYIPYSNATAALYHIATARGPIDVTLDQKAHKDEWVSLGTYSFLKGAQGVIRLGDSSGVGRQEIIFDAVRWSYRGVTEVAENLTEPLPWAFNLQQNYPNPFNPTTAVSYQLSAVSKTKIAVYDMLGREVAVLVNGVQTPGRYSVTWDGSGVSSGVYLYRMEAGGFIATRKMVLTK
jgi:hypothetical protein